MLVKSAKSYCGILRVLCDVELGIGLELSALYWDCGTYFGSCVDFECVLLWRKIFFWDYIKALGGGCQSLIIIIGCVIFCWSREYSGVEVLEKNVLLDKSWGGFVGVFVWLLDSLYGVGEVSVLNWSCCDLFVCGRYPVKSSLTSCRNGPRVLIVPFEIEVKCELDFFTSYWLVII